jgi:site-specific recombinase XerD
VFRRPEQKRNRLPIPSARPARLLDAYSNLELAREFMEWMVCQRYSPHTMYHYKRVVEHFLFFWGDKKLSRVTHLDVRAFLIETSRRDLSADVVHRFIWPLRCFFDFLCINGVVDEVAPRLLRPRPVIRSLPTALSEQSVRRLIAAADNPRDKTLFSGNEPVSSLHNNFCLVWAKI